jgi:acetyl esterase/lipase
MAIETVQETELLCDGPDGTPLPAILYRPAGDALAAVLDVHGGAWTMGDRRSDAAMARDLASHGIAVLSIEFRMPPAARYPATVQDVMAGLRWLKDHATELGTTPARVGFLGLSSGGHLALLGILRPSDPRYSGAATGDSADLTVKYAALCWPVSDPWARFQMASERPEPKLVEAHHAFWPDEAAMREGSPFDIVSRGDAQQLPQLLIVQGTADENLTPDMQHRFADAYRAKGGNVELAFYEGAPHAFIRTGAGSDAARDALALVVKFILRQANAA